MIKKTIKKEKKSVVQDKEHFEVLLEDFNSKFDVVLEHVSSHSTQLHALTNKVDLIAEDVEIIKIDIEFIKNELQQKVSRDEFAALERRMSLLENKVRTS